VAAREKGRVVYPDLEMGGEEEEEKEKVKG